MQLTGEIVWFKWWHATSGESGEGSWVVDTKDGLGVKIAFQVLPGQKLRPGVWSLLIVSTIDNVDGEGVSRGDSIRPELFQEDSHIRSIVGFSQKIGQSDLILARDLWSVVDGAVEGSQAERRHGTGVADSRHRLVLGHFVHVGEFVWILAHCKSCHGHHGLQRLSAAVGAEEGIRRLNGVDVAM